MENNEVYNQVVEIVSPFARDKEALAKVSRDSNFLKDLQVSSARLVDIILAFFLKSGSAPAYPSITNILRIKL